MELIESGKHNSEEIKELLLKFLNPMLDQGIDCLVLGCTHYPYLVPILNEIVPNHIKIIDSGLAVAQQTRLILKQCKLLNIDKKTNPHHTFYTNTNPKLLRQFVSSEDATINYLDF